MYKRIFYVVLFILIPTSILTYLWWKDVDSDIERKILKYEKK